MSSLRPDRIRNAASIVLIRNPAKDPSVLLGKRGPSAAFMPSKFVFPGGAVDEGDAEVPLARELAELCQTRLRADPTSPTPAQALATAAIRELWEESGLRLAARASRSETPLWNGFATGGHSPDASALTFVFRAITPPDRPRRFDARFFVADAARLAGDPDDFSAASDELSDLQWVSLDRVADLDLPFVQTRVLNLVARGLPNLSAPSRVPFHDNRTRDGSISYL